MENMIVPYVESNSPMKLWPALAPFARTLSIRGERETLFFYDTGLGEKTGTPAKPALILIHGLGDEADSWRRLIPCLQDQYRVLAPDLPGFGRSRAPGRINRRGHVAAILRLLELTGPAVLAGSSMGAIIAEAAALARPDLVRGLILLDGCFPTAAAFPLGFAFSALPFVGKKWYRAYRSNHDGAYRSLFGYYADLEKMSDEDRQFLRERVIARVESPAQERAYFASLRSLIWTYLTAKGRFIRQLRSFPGKMLILWGEKDRVLPAESPGLIRELRPDAVFAVIPGAGHLPQQERPQETAAAIGEWLTAQGW